MNLEKTDFNKQQSSVGFLLRVSICSSSRPGYSFRF
ncbi:BnaAnng23760D [Brassica napus]|uniref:BnaAnng23760D protein n=1 Tax=Brassica napus TaxID=3708 RepID=A0A078JP80_BRANA|nr:BnaAnng23760D [Brassica napus]